MLPSHGGSIGAWAACGESARGGRIENVFLVDVLRGVDRLWWVEDAGWWERPRVGLGTGCRSARGGSLEDCCRQVAANARGRAKLAAHALAWQAVCRIRDLGSIRAPRVDRERRSIGQHLAAALRTVAHRCGTARFFLEGQCLARRCRVAGGWSSRRCRAHPAGFRWRSKQVVRSQPSAVGDESVAHRRTVAVREGDLHIPIARELELPRSGGRTGCADGKDGNEQREQQWSAAIFRNARNGRIRAEPPRNKPPQ